MIVGIIRTGAGGGGWGGGGGGVRASYKLSKEPFGFPKFLVADQYGNCFKGNVGKTRRTGWNACMRVDIILNRVDLNKGNIRENKQRGQSAYVLSRLRGRRLRLQSCVLVSISWHSAPAVRPVRGKEWTHSSGLNCVRVVYCQHSTNFRDQLQSGSATLLRFAFLRESELYFP